MNKTTEIFLAGLVQQGYEPVVVSDKPDHIIFDYVVDSGRFVGRCVRHGIVVPPDFPATWPSGPHVSPHIHPIGQQGGHPAGSISASDFGGDWQYWSRPLKNTRPGTQPVAQYLSHIWHLWDSQ